MSQRNNSGLRSILRPLHWGLAPLAGLYWGVTSLRNYLFNIGYTPSLSFDPLMISVGNLSVGGTGKSPMIEYLVPMLRREHALAVLSRGYRRKTSGIRIAGDQDNAETLGDEPYQFYRKFGALSPGQTASENTPVVVAVGEERALAIPEILHHHPEINMILLDDAFQHRKVKSDVQILLTTYQRPFYKDRILPLGLLRESRKGAKRADVVIVTKCPEDIKEEEKNRMRVAIQAYAGEKIQVFFTAISYQSPETVFEPDLMLKEPVLLFSGIANADLFEAYARQQFKVAEHIRWEDHHRYSESDVKKVQEVLKASGAKSVLTTEKDMVKLIDPSQSNLWTDIPLHYLPIQVKFLANETAFQQYISDKIRSAEKE
ncbi:tetraacyldisaccharide 4'-kinase [Catalinimonas niigatensis]|uniref:tetraacyldisaccharide 4'-kinase n=1 Tax=Catalinimonas niigatensis TaxID=1397264 RepID=UPI0026667156|nr:tetraacyldisaccharide 4'-kinase [Catalinimonas niigatensis]WPP53101.1 tetraacyldisaccharide 4'-kinase [Catalinimonas niigatensis]